MSTPLPRVAARSPLWRRHLVSAVAIAACIAVAGLALAVVGGGASHASKAAPAGPPQSGSVAVAIQDFAFTPTALTVKVGSVVTWTNVDSEAHTVRTMSGDALHSGVLNTNDTFSHTFDAPGIYPYHCSIHPEMQATITVVN
jgi:plastocyanin